MKALTCDTDTTQNTPALLFSVILNLMRSFNGDCELVIVTDATPDVLQERLLGCDLC